MTCLDGIADEWDSCPHVRDRMRQHGTLFVKVPGKDKIQATIPCAQMNYHVLKPLVERLEESPGNLGVHAIPDLEKQSLVLIMQFLLGNFLCVTDQQTFPLVSQSFHLVSTHNLVICLTLG